MAGPVIQPANGLANWILESKLTFYDDVQGKYTEEVWAGLYSTHQAQIDVLKARGASRITPSKGGVVCRLTATFGGTGTTDGGGEGGGGSGEALTEQWSLDPDITECDLRSLPTWGPSTDLSAAENLERAKKISAVDLVLRQGRFTEIDFTGEAAAQAYGIHAALGIRGYWRGPFTLTKLTTWAKNTDAANAIKYENAWAVVPWASIGAPSWIEEPKYVDCNSEGAFELKSMSWLTFPPQWGAFNRVFSVRQSWKGALLWSGKLYKGGGAIS